MDIIETDRYRNLLQHQIDIYKSAEDLAKINKRYSLKYGVIAVENRQSSLQIVCGNFASFRHTTYDREQAQHAEMGILEMLPYDNISSITLYIAKLSKTDTPLYSRPCSYCMKQIKAVEEIHSIVYATADNRIVEEVMK